MATPYSDGQPTLARPRHARQPSSRSNLLKALVSPVKSKGRHARHDPTTPSKAEDVLGERSYNVRSPPRARSCHTERRLGDTDATKGAGISQNPTTAGRTNKDLVSVNPETDSTEVCINEKENAKPGRYDIPHKMATKTIPIKQPHTPGPQTTRISPRKISDSSTEASSTKRPLSIMKRGARVMAAVAAIQGKSMPMIAPAEPETLDPVIVERKFEAMLSSRNIAPAQRDQMRNLTLRMKIDLVKQHQGDIETTSGRSSHEQETFDQADDDVTSTKRSRSRGRTFTFSRGDRHAADGSPTKKQRGRSRSRPAPIDTNAVPLVSTVTTPTTPRSRSARANRMEDPAEYIQYLKNEPDPVKVEVGRLHKLRILLRNETVAWVDSFIELDGLTQVTALLHSVMALEWREDHEDQLLHETLLCLKGLCTTDSALTELCNFADVLLPALLAMLFDNEKKGPSEYSTRLVIINILFAYLSARAYSSTVELEARARIVLGYLSKPQKDDSSKSVPLDFVAVMQQSRPYKDWCKEVTNVTREVFWIFLHQVNVIPIAKTAECESEQGTSSSVVTYTRRHFPSTRPPVPAAPYIGGVEWDATSYITGHLDLLNGLIASLPTREARNALRLELRDSGFEKTMGATLRTCKEKFYGGVHDGLRAWVSAATEDEWPTLFVREGPTLEEQARNARSSPKKSPAKAQAPPKIEEINLDAPKLDINFMSNGNDDDNGWLG